MKHLTEEQLQMVAENPREISATEQQHLEECSRCSSALAFYRKLVQEISTEFIPALSMNFADNVLARLPKAVESKRPAWAPWLMLSMAALFGMALTALFSGSYILVAASKIIHAFAAVTGILPIVVALCTILLAVAVLEQRANGRFQVR